MLSQVSRRAQYDCHGHAGQRINLPALDTVAFHRNLICDKLSERNRKNPLNIVVTPQVGATDCVRKTER